MTKRIAWGIGRVALAGSLAFGMAGCNTGQQNASEAAVDPAQMAAGFQVLEASCFSCHNPDPSAQALVAPHLASLKTAYAEKGLDAAAMTERLGAFLDNPSPETSRMPWAVEQYGLMPRMSLSPEQVAAVAAYLFHTPLEKPNWYARSFAEEVERYRASPQQGPADYLEAGRQLAMETKSVLGRNLLQALQQGGPDHAVDFCSTRALTLTDSMAAQLGAGIRRVSDRNRNPANAAGPAELEYILDARAQIEAGQKPAPRVREHAGGATGYYPITTDAMCLACHGAPEQDISPSTLALIRERYPDDRATGFAEGDLRGIWVVDMPLKAQ